MYLTYSGSSFSDKITIMILHYVMHPHLMIHHYVIHLTIDMELKCFVLRSNFKVHLRLHDSVNRLVTCSHQTHDLNFTVGCIHLGYVQAYYSYFTKTLWWISALFHNILLCILGWGNLYFGWISLSKTLFPIGYTDPKYTFLFICHHLLINACKHGQNIPFVPNFACFAPLTT